MQNNLISTHFTIFCSLHVLMEMNQMPLKMLNRSDLIKSCFEAYMNFKGICNQNIFPKHSWNGMQCARGCWCGNTPCVVNGTVHVHVCYFLDYNVL